MSEKTPRTLEDIVDEKILKENHSFDSVFEAFKAVKIIAVRQPGCYCRLYKMLEDMYAIIPFSERLHAHLENRHLLKFELVAPEKTDGNNVIRQVIGEGFWYSDPFIGIKRGKTLSDIFEGAPVSFVRDAGRGNRFDRDLLLINKHAIETTVTSSSDIEDVYEKFYNAVVYDIFEPPVRRVDAEMSGKPKNTPNP